MAASSLSATAFVWAEGVVTVTFLASLTLLLKFYDRPSFWLGAATVAMAGLGFTGHSTAAAVARDRRGAGAVQMRDRRRWGLLAALTGATLAVTYAWFAFATMVFNAVWDDPASSNTVNTVVKRLPHIGANLRSALGETWYQLMATFGLTAVGAGVLLVRSLRRRGTTPYSVIRDARLVVLVTAPLILVSIVFMSHRTHGPSDLRPLQRRRPVASADRRHRLARPSSRTPYRRSAAAALIGIAVALVATSVGIHYVAGEALASSVGVRPMIAGLEPIVGSASSIDIKHVTIVSLVLMVILRRCRARRRARVTLRSGRARVSRDRRHTDT